MKRYALAVGAALVLVAALGLPPRHYDVLWWSRAQEQTPERIHFRALRDTLTGDAWAYQRIQWRDSVSRVLQAVDPSEDPFLVQAPPEVPETLLARLDSGIVLHLESIHALPPRVPVGVFLIPRDLGRHPSSYQDRFGLPWHRREIYVARAGESPFCALVEAVSREGVGSPEDVIRRLAFLPQDPRGKPNALRLCGYYARYGVPGSQIESWLRRGADVFASGINMDRRARIYLSVVGSPRGAFGTFHAFSGLSVRGLACIAGVDAACRRALLDPEAERDRWSWDEGVGNTLSLDSPVDFVETRYTPFGDNLGPLDPYVFSALEDEFGPERFERFWRSEAPVEEAFRQAFGVAPEDWMQSWAQSYYGKVDRGPTLPLRASALSLVTLGLLVLTSVLLARRRGFLAP